MVVDLPAKVIYGTTIVGKPHFDNILFNLRWGEKIWNAKGNEECFLETPGLNEAVWLNVWFNFLKRDPLEPGGPW